MKGIVPLLILLLTASAWADWKIDFSRRRQELKEREGMFSRSYQKAYKQKEFNKELPSADRRVRSYRGVSSSRSPQSLSGDSSSRRGPASLDSQYTIVPRQDEAGFLNGLLDRQAPAQEVVIMHTRDGFFPTNVQIYKNRRYKVHVVNVHESNKNVSFMMDSFSQHHGTYFGKPVSFVIEPRQEGLFPFQCPETAAQGHLVVTETSSPVPSPMEALKERRPSAATSLIDVER